MAAVLAVKKEIPVDIREANLPGLIPAPFWRQKRGGEPTAPRGERYE